MNTKNVTARMTLKAGDQGLVNAVFSTFNVIDSDHDVVLPTAFTNGQELPMTWAHNWAMPVGKGKVIVEPEQAAFDGSFFMNTTMGRDGYETVKAMGDLQEWSWGFQVLDAAYETRNGEQVRVIKRAEVFEVSPVLVGAGVGTYTRAIKGLAYADDGEQVLAACKAFAGRSGELASLRAKEGRVLSDANRKRLATLHEQLMSVAKDIKELLDSTEPDKGLDVSRLFMEYQQISARLQGVQV